MLKIMFPLALMLMMPKLKFHYPPLLLTLSILFMNTFINSNTKLMLTNFFLLDFMSSALIILTLWISALMMSVMLPNVTKPLTLLTLLLATTTTLSFSMNNILMFYIMFELSLIPIIMMILFLGYQPERIQAATYMLLYTVAASLPLFISIIFLYMKNSHLNFSFLNSTLPLTPNASIWAITITVAFMVKMPVYSVHLWLPKAHVEAPTAGSMILAALLLKLGGFGLLRLLSSFPLLMHPITPAMFAITSWGAAITTLLTVRQTDFKSLIAYSSIAHMSMTLTSMLTMTKWGWTGTYITMTTHGLCSSALFALAGMTFSITNTRSILITKGQITILPKMTIWWFIFAASNMAAPPFMNLAGEIMIFSSIMSKSLAFMVSIFLASFLSALYNLHLYTSMNHGKLPLYSNPTTTHPQTHYTSLYLHLLPLTLLTLKPEILMW
uniref:NADH-ubiquinone oxidoreductase chain 4 n=1 Tax=Cirriformia cf. tentaculata HK-2018 TaxID=2100094 RepID=A0A343UWF1_9ANNE|nr:NADH dehydrogenase subunit 4 [Cirriformia cf. tentaculata HK-2018]AVI26179.1 NADH dehydrogenase subunit 4 [Cirriformia cf. tentaculata HK-2018]